MEIKTQIAPLCNRIFILPYEENPYMQKESEEGFIYNDSTFDNPDTGEKDEMDQTIQCGRVVAVGNECKFIEEGDDVLFNIHTLTPIPFMRQGFFMTTETSILAVMNDNLDERLKK